MNGSLPPWLSVNPGDFVRAAQAGSALGLQVAQAQNRADEAQREQEFRRWSLEQELRQRAAEMAARREQATNEFEQRNRYNIARSKAQQAHYDAMEAHAKSLSEGKQYGEPLIQDIPGVPGGKYIYRPGSPGVHIVNPRGPSSLPLSIGEQALAKSDVAEEIKKRDALKAQIDQGKIPEQIGTVPWYRLRTPQVYAPNPEYSKATNNLAQMEAKIASLGSRRPLAAQTQTATTATPSPFKEGALIRNKKDGKTYRVQNGTPVPVEEPATVADTEGTEDENAD